MGGGTLRVGLLWCDPTPGLPTKVRDRLSPEWEGGASGRAWVVGFQGWYCGCHGGLYGSPPFGGGVGGGVALYVCPFDGGAGV